MKKIFINIFCFVIIFSGASVTLQAQLTNDTLGCVPLLATFKTPSDTLTGVLWDFGTGAKSNKKEANHVFINTGTFEVVLSNHGQVIATRKIVVLPKPEVKIVSDINRGCAPLTIQFTNQTEVSPEIEVLGYLWDFGDGNGSIENNPSNQYNDIGLFNLTLTLETNIPQCNVVKTFPEFITIDQKQNIGFRIDSIKPACTFPTFVHITNTGTINPEFSYKWNFGNGQTFDSAQPGPVQYNKDSLYTITLEVDNKQGCISKITRTVNINFFPKIRVSYLDTICGLVPVRFMNQTSATQFLWDFGTMADPQTSTVRNPEVRFLQDSTYAVKLRVTSDFGCIQDTVFPITIKDKSAKFKVLPDMICKLPAQVICEADVKSYQKYIWNGMPGASTQVFDFPEIIRDTFYEHTADSVSITLEIEDGDGCKSEETFNVLVQLPNALFVISDHEGVIPFNVKIFDESKSICPIVKWIIDWGDETSSEYDANTIKTANHTYYDAGTYYINMHIINEKGCEDKHYGAWVTAHDPIPDEEPIRCTIQDEPEDICYRDIVFITANPIPSQVDGLHYSFGHNVANCDQISYFLGPVYTDPGAYYPSVTLENGGTFRLIESEIPINIKGPKAVFDYEILCNNQYQVTFTNQSQQTESVEWIIEGNVITQNNFTHTFPGRGDYEVVMVAYNTQTGCTPDTAKATIRLRDVKAKIETDSLWCFNQDHMLISTGSEDEVVGCGMGYIWSFPSFDLPNIVTSYDTTETKLPPGEHLVVLEVRDVNGCRAYDTAYVRSFNIQADFITDRENICVPVTALFTDQSVSDTTIVRYSWSFMVNNNVPVISHTFTNIPDTTYYIGLAITDQLGCKSFVSKEFKTYKPVSVLTVPKIFCEEGTATFKASDFTINNSYLTYQWYIDSVLVSESMSFSPAGLSPGTHKGTLDIVEAATQCNNSYDFEFYVTKTPEAIISGLDDSVFCYPKTLQLSAASSVIDPKDQVTYTWYYSTGRTSNKINPVETFGKGEYNIRLRARSVYQCESYDEKNIRLVGPEGKMAADKDKICIGEKITFTLQNPKDVESFFWDFGQGEVDHNISPVSYTYDFYPPDGATFASIVLAGSEKNCQIVESLPITFYQIFASFLPDTICGNVMDITNFSQGDDIALWSWANQTSTSTDSIVRISVNGPGSYPLTLTIQNSEQLCRDTFSAVVRFLEQPQIALPNSISDCEDNATFIMVPPQFNYQISPSHLGSVNGDRLVIKTSETVNLDVLVISNDGCEQQKSITVTSIQNADTTINQNLYLCNGKENIVFGVDSTSGSQIIWEVPGYTVTDILSGDNITSPQLIKDYLGPLTATVINDNDCSVRIYHFEILDFDVELPNVFSPNGDDVNDSFRPVFRNKPESDELNIQQLKVFNRWGKEVYNGNKPWDGKMEGQPAKAEVYYYSMTYSIGNQCPKTVNGDVTLLR